MKVFVEQDGHKRGVGKAEVPLDAGVVFEVPIFGKTYTHIERFALGTVTTIGRDGALSTERGIILSPGQPPELLPGWKAFDA